MQPSPDKISFLANGPGEFQAELVLEGTVAPEDVPETEKRLAGSMGLNLQPNGSVVLTLIDEEGEDVSLEISSSDLDSAKQLLHLCGERLATDKAAWGADGDGETDSP